MRKYHRWIGLLACLCLLLVSVTGVLLQIQQLFGEEEAEKERQAALTSPWSLLSETDGIAHEIATAQRAVRSALGEDAPVDSIEFNMKADPVSIILWTGAGGGNAGRDPLKFTVNAATGAILKREPGERESFLLRLHTGEIFGDGGVALGIGWGTAMLLLTLTGMWLYWRMYRARARVNGWRRIFWMIAFGICGGMVIDTSSAHASLPFLADDPGCVRHPCEIRHSTALRRHVDCDVFANVDFTKA